MKNLIILLTILSSFSSCAQKVKLENFQIVSYEIDASNKVNFDSYSTIDEEGKLNVFINGSRGEAYYSYQLNQDEIKIINKLDKNNLEGFVKKKRLEANEGYAGNRNYISFHTNGKTEELCFILPFMSNEFNEILYLLEDKIYLQQDSAKISKFNIDFSKLEQEIIKQNKINNYLPQKQLPPPPMSR